MEKKYDFLVVGSGIAGLFYALKLVAKDPKVKIAIITKKGESNTSTNRAQGGIAAVFSKIDSFESHIKDTIISGVGLCHENVVEQIIEAGPKVIEELISYGVKFSTDKDGYNLGREGGHSEKRILHAGDLTGRKIERALLNACRNYKDNIDLYRNHIVLDLITGKAAGMEYCTGAFVFTEHERELSSFYAPVTLLASGGLGQIYFHNTNPKIATGDGIAMAYRAGLSLGNLEFVQFHPTSLYSPERWPFLISEAVRGEGARLLSVDGKYFMEGTHELEELAPRDIVARAVDKELKESGEEFVFLDISHKNPKFVKKRFPNIYKECLRRGFDMTKRPIPVVPAAHYSCGGIISKINGETELPGLYVAGEVAMSGMHGANRLASNSLLEAVVMAEEASKASYYYFSNFDFSRNNIEIDNLMYSSLKYPKEKVLITHDRRQLCRVMSDFAGIVRSRDRLTLALEKINRIADSIEEYYMATPATYRVVELRNMATVSKLLIQSALKRHESRGLHYLEEYPKTNDDFKKDTILLGRLASQQG
ncbi:MAG: L-aspartate oxidase [candidate division Zixibacteria bacterium]|nr:L-aspartate oxidase [candidate division Zixibacteria bacterium]